ncbi:MAG TPA: DUF6457 domain-containing protein [Actinoplanes sp.]|nr:DUF6457 domain-containing protein [Actinoplanes sp.]
MRELEPWLAAVSAELGLTPDQAQVPLILDLSRDVAHHVLRPGAPVTAYLLGLAVGAGADPADAAARVSALTATWPSADLAE